MLFFNIRQITGISPPYTSTGLPPPNGHETAKICFESAFMSLGLTTRINAGIKNITDLNIVLCSFTTKIC